MGDERGEEQPRVQVERRGDHILHIVLNRPDKYNAFDSRMLRGLAEAYTTYEEDDALWCAVLRGSGAHFTSGLDLGEVGPKVAAGEALFPEALVDPLGMRGRRRTKPVIVAVSGWCLTIGIELMLASDIRVAAEGARFGQIEVNRGIFPFGGATFRWPRQCGHGDAMRYLLTGEEFGPEEAYRMGLVQEVCPEGELVERASALAERVASRAPLGVQATLESARIAVEEGSGAAIEALDGQLEVVFSSEDAAEGMQSFLERREAEFEGK